MTGGSSRQSVVKVSSGRNVTPLHSDNQAGSMLPCFEESTESLTCQRVTSAYAMPHDFQQERGIERVTCLFMFVH